ncbi:MAG: DUF3891 family protein [Phycisphaerae bacterium]|nr:DUF3891 family protein [Phycisphaerae bacterium]
MIRRLMGSEWLLIAQVDHAHLAGELADRIGNEIFDPPDNRSLFHDAVANHDQGWIEADRKPTLNLRGEPIDFTEIAIATALSIWGSSAEQAADLGPLPGLLVSLHSLSLSIMRGSDANIDATRRFALNKFQHRQIELQESCRKKLGLAGDIPLHHGLPEKSDDPRDKSIVHQFRLLQAMDAMSLAACCSKPPATELSPVFARAGGRAHTLRIRRSGEKTLHISPWPFDVERFNLDVPARPIPAEPFVSPEALHDALASAASTTLTFTFAASR